MERLVNSFSLDRPIEEAWRVLTDLERIAPCMPGARLKEVEGDTYRGTVKVRVGAFSTEFEGEARFEERDSATHRAVLKAAGLARGGLGQAEATVVATLTQAPGDQATTCRVETDMDISGKVAQFGRGLMADISGKLMAQFAANLDRMLGEAVPAGPAGPGADATNQPPQGADPGPDDAGGIRKVDSGAVEAIDLSRLGGPAVLKGLLPGVAALVVLVWLLRRRHS